MSIEVSNIDHLGLVAGIIDEIGIEQKINQLLGEELPEKITSGQVVKGMVLNGLGLVSSTLIEELWQFLNWSLVNSGN